jgi:nucleoside-diphosphate-sugar epimerase
MDNALSNDLDDILQRTLPLWEEFRRERIFITGGTGFFGCWLLESFLWANDHLQLNASATVLTRNAENFRKKAPLLAAHPAIVLHEGDIRFFEWPLGHFSHVIHCATEASAQMIAEQPLRMLETIVDGTRRALDFAVSCGTRKFLLASSGAIYGKQPPELVLTPETYSGAPDPTNFKSSYGEGKRVAELLCSIYNGKEGLDIKIARCFAFVGPYLPIDTHFAIGNFIRDSLDGKEIFVNGDGRPYRSYLYAADLMVWLWTILINGFPMRPYNVGSENEIGIADLARLIASGGPNTSKIRIGESTVSGALPERYVPCTYRIRSELSVDETFPLQEAIRRTTEWNKLQLVTARSKEGL